MTMTQEKAKIEPVVKAEKEKPKITAEALSSVLQGTVEQRKEEEKTIVIRMIEGQRPEVDFTGFWTGKLMKAAINGLSRAYRLRRHRMIGKAHEVANTKEEGR